MDLSDSPSEAAFRHEARTFLEQHVHEVPADLSDESDEAESIPVRKKWQRTLFDNGWAAITWPERHGGRGLGPVEQISWNQECVRAKTPSSINIVGIGMAGPAIIEHGSDEQRDRYLSRILSGEEIWCQLFSEPNAGSDLPALATSAKRDGDEWVVNGQKVWSSAAHFADWGILLARTDSSVPKRKGITFFLVDMTTPGVTVRPLRQMNGKTHFNEVFLDDVRIPDGNRVGEVGGGWGVATTTLLHERMAVGGSMGVFNMDDLIGLANSRGDVSPHERDLLARTYIYDRCLELLNARVMSKLAHGEIPTAEGSIAKLALTRMLAAAANTALSILGPRAIAEPGIWQNLFLITPGIRVGGGTDDIQRNMIAERVLGLPRDEDESRTLPFDQLRRN